MMPRWRVDYIGKGGKHLGTVEAPDERRAIAEAAKVFHITPARRFKLRVTRIETERDK
jgi:1,2-phenylacetyl-CoA epoxidase PaaB subunit